MDDFITGLKIEYFDSISEFSIPFVIGIFAFVLPLLLHTIGRIDEIYKSTMLIKVFRKDLRVKTFISVLIVALICCILWIFQIPRCVDLGKNVNYFIEDSALILLTTSTIILIGCTLCVVHLAYIYYLPEKLFERLKKQYYRSQKKSSKKEDASMYFTAISKIMHCALRKSDKVLSEKTYKFFAQEFTSYRDKTTQAVDYPDEYYNFIIETNEIIFLLPREKTTYFDESAIISLLMDKISSRSFYTLWYGIKQALSFDNDKFIFAYWKRAHQYFCTSFSDNCSSVSEEKRVLPENRKDEREHFLEFHYVLGGLLMMKEKYPLLKQLFVWTHSDPPQYFLVPNTLSEVIVRFMSVDRINSEDSSIYYDSKYPFPDVSGVNANEIIKLWLKKYLAVLFLRQYTLYQYLVILKPLAMPAPPHKQNEIERWKRQFTVLKRFVNEYLNNKEMLKSLGLGELSEEDWFIKNNKQSPNDLIDEYVKQLEGMINAEKNTDS